MNRRNLLGCLFALPFIGMVKPTNPKIFWATEKFKLISGKLIKSKASISVCSHKPTDLYISPEVLEDIKNWGVEPEYYI